MDSLTREDDLLASLLKSKQDMFGYRAVKGNFDYSNNEIVKLKMLTGVTKTNNYNSELQRNLFCSGIWPRAEDIRFILEDSLLRAQEWSIPMYRKSIKQSRRPEWIIRKHLDKFKSKTKIKTRWKWGQTTQEEYKGTVQGWKDAVRKGRAHLQLNQTRGVMGNKKIFCRYIRSKRKAKGSRGPHLNEAGNLVTKDL